MMAKESDEIMNRELDGDLCSEAEIYINNIDEEPDCVNVAAGH